MEEIVRVVLFPKDADAETAGDRQIIVDMKVDTATGVSTGPFPAFGRVGDYKKPETVYPFTLMHNGRMDYGKFAAEDQSQAILEVRTAKLVVGEEVARRNGDQTEIFVINKVTPVLG